MIGIRTWVSPTRTPIDRSIVCAACITRTHGGRDFMFDSRLSTVMAPARLKTSLPSAVFSCGVRSQAFTSMRSLIHHVRAGGAQMARLDHHNCFPVALGAQQVTTDAGPINLAAVVPYDRSRACQVPVFSKKAASHNASESGPGVWCSVPC